MKMTATASRAQDARGEFGRFDGGVPATSLPGLHPYRLRGSATSRPLRASGVASLEPTRCWSTALEADFLHVVPRRDRPDTRSDLRRRWWWIPPRSSGNSRIHGRPSPCLGNGSTHPTWRRTRAGARWLDRIPGRNRNVVTASIASEAIRPAPATPTRRRAAPFEQ